MTSEMFNIKKWFSMKNDTVEDAELRLKRSLICIPISIIPTVFMAVLQDAQMSRFVEYTLFAIYCICIFLSCFVALSSPIGPIKVAFTIVKWFFKNPLVGALILLYPVLLILSVFIFAVVMMSIFTAPIFMTLYGVYLSKKNLEEVRIETVYA